jgi:6-oxo-cyclohex-1-ene-carbonyl-CoA hydrolase
MHRKGYLSKVAPVIHQEGEWIRNPMVITEKYVQVGAIVYGENKVGKENSEARDFVNKATVDFQFLDKALDDTPGHSPISPSLPADVH